MLVMINVAVAAQSSFTVMYKQEYFVDSLRKSSGPELKGGLYVMGDTMTVYRLAWKEKELMKKLDLSSRDAHHGILKPMKDCCYYEIVHLQNEYCYIRVPDDTNKWTIDTTRNIIVLDKKCMAATRGDEVAWFAPSMPIKAGPGNDFGLPELVLAVFNNRYNMVTLAYKIVPSVPEIVTTRETPIVSLEQFREIQKKRVTNSDNNLQIRKF